ncbi:MAG: selenide, water dikinase SelD [Mucinivorans sp.]
MKYDLLSLGVQGGCSAKIPAGVLDQLLSSLEIPSDRNVIINGKTHDDAGVYQLNKEQALIVTTDFFPPICSDPYEFGQIAAANSLSDVYAMGGRALLVLNLNMFPSAQLPMEVLAEILRGGQSKINEAGALTMGGHTIDDQTVKYGLAVVGLVAPDRVVGNHGAKVGDSLILTKPLGIGVAVAAHRMKMGGKESYRTAIENMKTLNNHGAEIMQRFDVCGATDITGFGLLGHARGMALASGVTLHIHHHALPLIDGTRELLAAGCVPSTVFKNLDFVRQEVEFTPEVTFEDKALAADAQTSGGLLISVAPHKAPAILAELQKYYPSSAIIGSAQEKTSKAIVYST